MLESARRKLTDLNNVQFVHASCLHTGLEDATLDTVLMANVLQMVSDRHAALAEASRVLRPGGRLLILAWTATGMSLWGRFKMMWHYLRQMGLPPRGARNLSPDQAQELTQANGFDVDEMKMLGRNVKCMFMRAHKPREEPK
jgi:ubiquinone/menaquinone biosynthesis C-methylase UbiE